ncbi:MAG TPA: DUF1800 domain-containing protein [Blastocatellia bacterium]|nr:DUF1800 domain-containing protein [Blastocatellia bacterium]
MNRRKIHYSTLDSTVRGISTKVKTLALISLTAILSIPIVPASTSRTNVSAATVASQDQAIVHLLNRITYGPRPGDVERVKEMGVNAFIEEQLHPERIEDSKITDRVKQFETLNENTQELYSMQPKELVTELQQAKVLRAIYSERQLNEVMVDFWQNHFNVFVGKGADRFLMTAYDRDTIRPHAMGKFKDLLLATAESPAMLFYLDNWMNSTPNVDYAEVAREVRAERQQNGQMPNPNFPGGINRPVRPGGGFGGVGGGIGAIRRQQQRQQQQQKQAQGVLGKNRKLGINENYAREIMELHTLGVNGGYTQKDVIEVAKCLTGWSIRQPRNDGEFVFREGMHEKGDKFVLGQKINAGGMRDGLQVIDLLAHHPSTAKFISTKLVRRFVSDNPPQSLVDKVAQTFMSTDGDIRSMLKTIFTSQEFNSPDNYRAKMKTPLEMAISAVRAVGGEATDASAIVRQVGRMGMPLYQAQPPTGYPDVAESWINTGLLLERMNFALQLAANKLPGVSVDVKQLAPGANPKEPATYTDHLIKEILHGSVSQQTMVALNKPMPQLTSTRFDGNGTVADNAPLVKTVALLLGSPEFQRR